MRALRVGVAVGEDVFAASWAGGSSEWTTAFSAGPTAEAIGEACADVNRLIEAKRVIASVAILPALARMRRIELPRMSEDDYRLAVTTNAQRYFLGLGQSPVCGTVRIGTRKRGCDVPLLAFAASSELIESIAIGLTSAGWTIERIVPAHTAWVASVVRRHPSSRRESASIGVRMPRETNIVEVEAGSITGVRRLRAGETLQPIEPARRWFVIGSGEPDQSAARIAAAAAPLERRFEIIPDSSRRARAARDRRVTRLFGMVACANLLIAAVAFRWRLERQLTIVAARRSAIHERASRAMTAQDSVRRLVERIAAMAELERSAPRWSAVLSRIVVALPADAELASIRAESDSVMIDGQATDASRVLSGLQRTAAVRSTKVSSPILHELSADQVALERWRLALRIDHRAATRP